MSALALGFVAVVLACLALFGQAAASEASTDCRFGAISAIGPVDAQGRGDTTPDVVCLEP